VARPGLIRDALGALPILGLLAAVYLLPSDTSLSEVHRAGALHVCMPPDAPPFVTGAARAPGIDIELLQALTRDLGLTLAPVPEPAMGQDFNPRAWHVTRAACAVLAGGLVASPMTRSFLETSPPYAETGWALLAPQPIAHEPPPSPSPASGRGLAWGHLHERKIGVLTPPSGLDRIALASYLRAAQAQVIILTSAEALVTGLRAGRFDFGVTEMLLADQIATRENLVVDWLRGDLPRYPVAFGLWKGDLTLKRALAGGLDRLARDGTVAAVMARYLGGRAVGAGA
jgi:ABC-type amino acid transport substrate-binding protein